MHGYGVADTSAIGTQRSDSSRGGSAGEVGNTGLAAPKSNQPTLYSPSLAMKQVASFFCLFAFFFF